MPAQAARMLQARRPSKSNPERGGQAADQPGPVAHRTISGIVHPTSFVKRVLSIGRSKSLVCSHLRLLTYHEGVRSGLLAENLTLSIAFPICPQ